MSDKMVDCVCVVCSNVFRVYQSKVNKGGRKFCSRECMGKSFKERPHKTFIGRFWKSVRKTDDCWLWMGMKLKKGYGRITVDGKKLQTHRLSWEIHFGVIPDGMCVCHVCDNPPCVRPDHLFLGTEADNSNDKVAKERQARGERVGSAILTESLVEEIRSTYAAGSASQYKLAGIYGVSRSAIKCVVERRTWKHLP